MATKTIDNHAKVASILNNVRELGDNAYQASVPVYTQDTLISDYGKIILDGAYLQNSFINVLQNIVFYEIYNQHIFDNEFSRRFKREVDVSRAATFETFVNPINPLKYDGTQLDRILRLYKRDIKKMIFARNRMDVFPVSINPQEVASAFQSEDMFISFLETKYKALQDSNAIVEWNMIKELINVNTETGNLITVDITGKSDKELATMLREYMTKMSKPSSKFNNYINIEGATGEPVITSTPKDKIIFMPDAKMLASLDVNVIAGAYNMAYADVTRNILSVDDFGYNVYNRENQTIAETKTSKIRAVLCDEAIFKFDESLSQQLGGVNPATMTQQTFYHVWQTIAMRPVCNCIVFIDNGSGDEFSFIEPTGDVTTYASEIGTHFDISYKGTIPENIGDASSFAFTSLTPGVSTEIDNTEGKIGLEGDKFIFTLTGTTPTEYTSENPLKGVFTFTYNNKVVSEFIIKLVGNIPVTAV